MSRLKRSLMTALTFALVGPLIAVCGVGLLFYGMLGVEGDDPGRWLGILWLLPFAYIFGALPAAATGAAAGALLGPTRPVAFAAVASLAGAVICSLIGFFDAETWEWDEGVTNLAIIGAIAGALSALVSLAIGKRGSAAPTDA
jgi:hypothetical protein